MLNRRQFLKLSAAAGASTLLPWRSVVLGAPVPIAYAQQGTPLPGSAIPQFIDPLPGLDVIIDQGGQIELHSKEFLAPVMPSAFVPAAGPYNGTYVWGYLQSGQTSRASYLGPVIVAERGQPTEIKWVNDLGNADTTNVLAYKYSTDQTLHWADPLNQGMPNMCAHSIVPGQAPTGYCALNYAGPIPDVTHLHGGEVPAQIDGGPDAWYTSDGTYQGDAYYAGLGGGGNSTVFRYPNSQEAASIWFHPHPLGVTRLNVYAGLAGAYLITDPDNPPPANLPGPADIIPLVIQDRSFDVNGQLYFPNVGINAEHPFWIPELVGDTIVVNGKVWPFKSLEAKRYRFLFLNGSNARTYEMFLVDPITKVMGPPMWVIGTDGGYLDTPVKIDPNVKPNDKLLMMPGERYDVIIDFNDPTWLASNPNFSGTLILRNTGRTPYPKGASPQGSTLGRIMLFRIGAPPAGGDNSYDPSSGAPLRTSMIRLVDPAAGTLAPGVTAQLTRQLTLNEVMGPGGPLEVLVNNTKWDGMREDPVTGDRVAIPDSTNDGIGNYLTELPNEGDTEVWEIINLTADAHPIHLHLVQFQLMNRQNFNVNKYNGVYNAAFPGGVFIGAYGPPKPYNFYATAPNIPARGPIYGGNPDITPYLQGKVQPPLPQEAGWKDTVVMYPGQVTRIAVRWAPTSLATDLEVNELYYPFDPSGSDYVWHCHILDHEDNEMMRPDKLTPNSAATRTYIKGTDY